MLNKQTNVREAHRPTLSLPQVRWSQSQIGLEKHKNKEQGKINMKHPVVKSQGHTT